MTSREAEGATTTLSRVEEIERVIKDIEIFAGKEGYDAVKRRHLKSALYEVLANAIVHGNKEDERKKVSVVYSFYGDEFEVKIIDEGDGFDIHSRQSFPDDILSGEGRGILFIESFADRVFFNEKSNEITMILKKDGTENDVKR